MARSRLVIAGPVLVWLASAAALCAASPAPDFADGLYQVLEKKNCRACHQESGVASATRVHFPSETASQEQIGRFGISLAAVVDRNAPQESLLLSKPTNRIPHTGGALIEPGSPEEQSLLEWIRYLARLPAEQLARERSQQPSAIPKAPLRRLTHSQYNNTVRDLLGNKTRPAARFPAEDFVNGYQNQVAAQSITPLLAEAYSNAAEKLARDAFRFGGPNRFIACEPAEAADRSCASKFIHEFGLKAFRRPLTENEHDIFLALFLSEARSKDDFHQGARLVVETMLQAPDFLFLVESGDSAGRRQYHVASRLSYFLWDTTPDDELLRAADAGELSTAEAVEKQARRMLGDPQARRTLDQFLAQWLRFDRALGTVKDAVKYKNFTPQVAEGMTEETRRLFGHFVWGGRDFRGFFNADFTFANDFLTELYGLEPPPAPFALVRFPADFSRAGVLGHGTYLAQTGKPDETSPTERGLFIREHFLCQTVPPPPPGVNAALPPLRFGAKPQSTREVLTQMHTTNESCHSCHKLVDPIGFGFEKFDTTGRRREKQVVTINPTRQQRRDGAKQETHELAIDTSGQIAGLPDAEFSTAKEVGPILAESPTCHKCLAKQLFRYAFGRHETSADAATIDRAYAAFRDSRFRFQELIIALVTSKAFLSAGGS